MSNYNVVHTASNSTGGGAGTCVVTITSTTAGNTLLVFGAVISNTGGMSVTDSQSNTYTSIDTKSGASATSSQLWILNNIPSGITSVTLGITGLVPSTCIVREYSGLTSSALDQHVVATANSTNPSSGNTGSTVQANEMVFGYSVASTTGASSLGAGYGNLSTITSASLSSAIEDKSVSSTGTQSASFVNSNAVSWCCGCATFKSATAPLPSLTLLGVGN